MLNVVSANALNLKEIFGIQSSDKSMNISDYLIILYNLYNPYFAHNDTTKDGSALYDVIQNIKSISRDIEEQRKCLVPGVCDESALVLMDQVDYALLLDDNMELAQSIYYFLRIYYCHLDKFRIYSDALVSNAKLRYNVSLIESNDHLINNLCDTLVGLIMHFPDDVCANYELRLKKNERSELQREFTEKLVMNDDGIIYIFNNRQSGVYISDVINQLYEGEGEDEDDYAKDGLLDQLTEFFHNKCVFEVTDKIYNS